jgi:hypothetical protein
MSPIELGNQRSRHFDLVFIAPGEDEDRHKGADQAQRRDNLAKSASSLA